MRHTVPFVLALVLTVTGSASAAWLVTHDGELIETSGDWKVDGRVILFTPIEGQLSSIRASEVDIEASRARSQRQEEEAIPESTPSSLRTVLVLTDDDVGHVRPLSEAAKAATQSPSTDEDGSEVGDAEGDDTAPTASVIEVVNWNERVDVEKNQLEVFGSVTNSGAGVATRTRLEVRLLDRSGELLERRRATLGEAVLRPGAVVPFSASFPGSPGFATVEFDIRSRGFQVREPIDATPAGLPVDDGSD